MNIVRLIDEARLELGSYTAIAEKLHIGKSKITDIRKDRYKPSPAEILQIAELAKKENPVSTLFEVMAELDSDNAEVWNKWRPHGDSNPGYRRESAITLAIAFYHKFKMWVTDLRHQANYWAKDGHNAGLCVYHYDQATGLHGISAHH